jgi:CRP/FNR family cyclic AMP-dependent transcriptional regulator
MPALARDGKLGLVADVPLFRPLSRRQLRQVGRLLDLTTVPAGRRLTEEGEVGREFFVIVAGEAEVTRAGEVVAVLRAGDVVGELALLADDHRRSATVTARTPLQLLVGPRPAFPALLDASPHVRAAVLAAARSRDERDAAPAAAHAA